MSYTMGPPETDYSKLQRAKQEIKNLVAMAGKMQQQLRDMERRAKWAELRLEAAKYRGNGGNE